MARQSLKALIPILYGSVWSTNHFANESWFASTAALNPHSHVIRCYLLEEFLQQERDRVYTL